VVRDIRIVSPGDSGMLFLAFPSRKRGVRCQNRECRSTVDPGDSYCARCGEHQANSNAAVAFSGHKDCCFPVNSQTRVDIEEPIIEAYRMAIAHPELNSFSMDGAQVQVDRKVARDAGGQYRSDLGQ